MISLEHLVRFGLGMVVVGALYAAVRAARLHLAGWRTAQALLRGRSHFALAGFVAALAFPLEARQEISESIKIAAHLLGAWLAFAVGCSLDRRAFRHTSSQAMILEATRFLVCVFLVLAASYAAVQSGAVDGKAVTIPAVIALAAVVGFGAKTLGRPGNRRHGIARERKPMVGSALAAALFAVAADSMRGGDILIRAPFAPPGRVLIIESGGNELILALVLGSLLGLGADLLTRDCHRRHVSFLLILCLMFGGGIAAVCGIEPIGVGLVAAIWLMNTTLRRLDVWRAVTAGEPFMRGGIYFAAGFFLGGLPAQGFAGPTFFYAVLAIAAVRPLAAMGAVVAARHLLAVPTLRSLHISTETYFGSSDLALAAALMLGYLLPVPAGISIVAGVMAAQWLLLICNELFKERDFFNRAARVSPVQPLARSRL